MKVGEGCRKPVGWGLEPAAAESGAVWKNVREDMKFYFPRIDKHHFS